VFVPWLAYGVLQAREALEGLSLFVSIRENCFELLKESLGVLPICGASLLPEVSHPSAFARREGVVNGIPVIVLGERRV
jgi:hypothetical protein